MNSIYLILITLFFGCTIAPQSQDQFSLTEIQLKNCVNKNLEFTIPEDYIKNERIKFKGGFAQKYSYANHIEILIVCKKKFKGMKKLYTLDNTYSREEKIHGITIMYFNVTKDKKEVFDFAFDQMMK